MSSNSNLLKINVSKDILLRGELYQIKDHLDEQGWCPIELPFAFGIGLTCRWLRDYGYGDGYGDGYGYGYGCYGDGNGNGDGNGDGYGYGCYGDGNGNGDGDGDGDGYGYGYGYGGDNGNRDCYDGKDYVTMFFVTQQTEERQ